MHGTSPRSFLPAGAETVEGGQLVQSPTKFVFSSDYLDRSISLTPPQSSVRAKTAAQSRQVLVLMSCCGS